MKKLPIEKALRKWPGNGLTNRLRVNDYIYDAGELKFKIGMGSLVYLPTYMEYTEIQNTIPIPRSSIQSG